MTDKKELNAEVKGHLPKMAKNQLKEITIKHNPICDYSMEAFGVAIGDCTSITSLTLNGCSITDIGVAHLVAGLLINKSITQVDLGRNNIGDTGLGVIAGLIQENTKLASIAMNENDFGNAGAFSVATALTQNTTLTHLDLSIRSEYTDVSVT